uniref:RING-type E3 ubiquitin transferase n=1 Tax=Fagus sylvatica TaxID=28930 RepID=A0A2N9IWR3_FAGSY
MASSGLLPSGSLLESLIHISNEVANMEKVPCVQYRNISTMIRRIKLLYSLFEEIQDTNGSIPPSSILCLTELFSVIRRVKGLIQECKDGSCVWGLIQTQFVSNQFYVLVKQMGRALDILPVSLLDLTADTREQVELLHKQVKRVDSYVDPRELQRREVLLQVMASEKNSKNKGFIDFGIVKEIMSCIGLINPFDYEEEISKLEVEAKKQARTGGLIVKVREQPDDYKQRSASIGRNHDYSSSSQSVVVPNIPDEFRCPITLDLMRDPVIVASGHTYDRNSIARWINSGHYTCPKSGQKLLHMALIPNYALKCLIQQWYQDNSVSLNEDKASSFSDLESSNSKGKQSESAVDHISATKAVADAVKMTAEFLVGKLATGSVEIQRQAAYELHLLVKTGMDNHRIIAEAGAIPFLVTLLSSHDPRIQENAVTALLNLSLFQNNKILIMAAGAIDHIIDVLQAGKTMEARENAATAIFSLSMIDDCKVTIGARPRAIPALVGLLSDGSPAGKRDAATALFNLAVYNANKTTVAVAGAVPVLIDLLMDDKAGVTDDALAVLALLLGCSQGLEEIRKSRVLVPLLTDLLRFGSYKGKENSITLLLGLCKDGGEEVARCLLINPRGIPSLQSLAANGLAKARRKADALVRLLNRCCSQSQIPVG